MTHLLAASAEPESLLLAVRAPWPARDAATLPADPLTTVWQVSGAELARLAASLGLRKDQAEDVLQDVYVTALAANGKLPTAPAELRLWLFRVTVNRCHLEHRRRGRWQKVLRSFWKWGKQDMGVDVAAACQLDHERALVRQALATLDEDVKTPLVLRYFCDLDSREIGEILQLPDSTVRSRLRAGRKLLAAELLKAGFEDDKVTR